MSETTTVWPADALDAVGIWAPGARITIEGSDADQVQLEGDLGTEPEKAGRWLRLYARNERPFEVRLHLRLPKRKAWVVELSALWGQVEIRDVQARFQVLVQKGDVCLANCRGVFDVTASEGSVRLMRCLEAAAPERPAGGESYFPYRSSRPWTAWDAEDWSAWGMEFGEQVSTWARQFGRFMEHADWRPLSAGVNVRLLKGNARLENIEARACSVRLTKGNLTLEGGRVADLQLSTASGNVECRAVFPEKDWEIAANHGDLHLSLPADAQARLDAATRHGDIRSEVPLVRVARPGPEARRGGRMVGTLGAAEGGPAQIRLTTLHGDIHIDVQPGAARRPAEPAVPVQAPAQAAPEPVRSSSEPVETPVSPQDPRLAVLQALSEGVINVQEAEQLLASLEPE